MIKHNNPKPRYTFIVDSYFDKKDLYWKKRYRMIPDKTGESIINMEKTVEKEFKTYSIYVTFNNDEAAIAWFNEHANSF